jgi:DNA modification methylase
MEVGAETKLVDELNSVDWSFEGEYTRIDTHGMHPYPAKFPPQIPATILRIVKKYMDVNSVLDPFGGSGTTALEAAKLGALSTTNDLNKITLKIVAAKLMKPDTEEERILKTHLDDVMIISTDEEASTTLWGDDLEELRKFIPDIPNIDKWFAVQVQHELAAIKYRINSMASSRLQNYCLAVLSSIITSVSFQEEETKYRSLPRDVTFGNALKTYASKLKSVLKMSKSLPNDLTSFVNMTSKDMRLDEEFDRCFDICITSPPYPNVTDYHLYHRHRNFWLGEDPVVFGKAEIGSHLRHQKEKNGFEQYLLEMTTALKNIQKSMSSGGLLFMVVGSGIFKGVEYHTSQAIKEKAMDLGFSHITTINRKLPKNNRSFTGPGRRATEEQIVVLKKGRV